MLVLAVNFQLKTIVASFRFWELKRNSAAWTQLANARERFANCHLFDGFHPANQHLDPTGRRHFYVGVVDGLR